MSGRSSIAGSNGAAPEVRAAAICGAGGHAKVVADVLSQQLSPIDIEGFLDDREELHGTEISGHPVLGSIDDWLSRNSSAESALIIGIGDNQARERVAERAKQAGVRFVSAVHRSVLIGSDVEIGTGSVLMPNVVLNAAAVIGEHVIINTSASVDHDCIVEDFAHISPGVNLAGGVTVGRGAHIGIGACAVPGVHIGEWAKVGAGSTVKSDVPPYATVVGNPAESLRSRLRRSAVS